MTAPADVLTAAVRAAQAVLLLIPDEQYQEAEARLVGLQQLAGLYGRHSSGRVTALLEQLAAELRENGS